jgi:hypothetical protein
MFELCWLQHRELSRIFPFPSGVDADLESSIFYPGRERETAGAVRSVAQTIAQAYCLGGSPSK